MTHAEANTLLLAHTNELRELGVASLALFGSLVRGDTKASSDVDVLVRFSKPVGLFEFLDTKAFLEDLFDAPVDLVTQDALKPQLREQILAEAVPVA